MGRLTIYLPDDLHEDLKEVSDGNQSEIIQRALRREFGYEVEENPDVQSLSKQIEEIENRLERIERGDFKGRLGVGKIGVDIPIESDPENDR